MGPTKVLIVGAGPTGLVLALWLRKKNIPFRIIDRSNAAGLTSRALAIQARTLEFYRQLGIADDLIEAGIVADRLVLYRTGRPVATALLGAMGKDLSPFAYLLFCSQDVHEKLLIQKLSELGVFIERETELVEFSQDEAGVRARVKTSRGEQVIGADFLVGCDGAHSVVRHGLKIDFPGGTYSQKFFVADVQATGMMAQNDRVQISLSPKDFCIVMPIKATGSVRLTGLLPPGFEARDNITFEEVAPSVKKNTGLHIEKVNWFSYYHVHHRVAERFGKGRVFLAGDACHIHSPAGGQGMNTGIGDSLNLAWKLAEVIEGCASEKLLASYEIERRAFAQVLVKTTDTAFKFLADQSFLGSVFRAFVLPRFFATLTKSASFVKFAFRTISQIRINYRRSFLSQADFKPPQNNSSSPGDRLPWVKSEKGDNQESLGLLGWQVHVYGEARPGLAQESELKLTQFEWNADASARGLLKDAAYLIRPDGYIGFISKSQDAVAIKAYLKRL